MYSQEKNDLASSDGTTAPQRHSELTGQVKSGIEMTRMKMGITQVKNVPRNGNGGTFSINNSSTGTAPLMSP